MKDRAEHLRRLRKMLTQVAPQGQLESMVESMVDSTPESFAGQPQRESLGMGGGTGEQDIALARSGLETLSRTSEVTDRTISEDEQYALEAIILPRGRPVVNIVNDTFQPPPSPWAHLGIGESKRLLDRVIPSIGRVEVPNHQQIPYAGTAFVVGPNLLMTNRHVAEIFATGLGVRQLVFRAGQTAGIDFKQEILTQTGEIPQVLRVDQVVMIHPYWDMALLRINGLQDNHPPLVLSVRHPEDLLDGDIAVIGYPAQDPRNQVDLQNTIFGGVFNVKRLQPGKVKGRAMLSSFGHQVNTLTHDASTLGGNSGSAVIDVATGEVVALHFAGIYLEANYSVPTLELARDGRVVDLGVNFAAPAPSPANDWKPFWDATEDGGEGANGADPGSLIQSPPQLSPQLQTPPVQGGVSTTWTIPLQVTITLGTPVITTGSAAVTIAPQPPVDRAPGLDEGLFRPRSQESNDRGYARFAAARLADSGFSWNGALNGADASNLSYAGDNDVINQTRNKWQLATCETVHRDSTHCFVASTSDAILIAFRGTKEFTNWLTNLNLVPASRTYGTVHLGFLNAFRSVEERLNAIVGSIGVAGRKVVLTGHSLGGALATIAAAEWHGTLPISTVYTYGQPAVGFGNFRNFINANYAGKFFRFVNDDDIVTRVPPGFVHVGRLFHFGSGSDVSNEAVAAVNGAGEETPTMSRAEFERFQASLRRSEVAGSTESLGLEGFFPSVSDHGMDRYIGKILKQLGVA